MFSSIAQVTCVVEMNPPKCRRAEPLYQGAQPAYLLLETVRKAGRGDDLCENGKVMVGDLDLGGKKRETGGH